MIMQITETTEMASLKQISMLASRIWPQHYTPLIGEAQVDYMLDKFQSLPAICRQIEQGYHYFLIRDTDQAPLGYFAFILKPEELFLSKIYLLAQHRGKGYGRKTLLWIESQARKMRKKRIVLTVNKNNSSSIKFYEHCGFVNAGARIQDIGNGFIMDDYQMGKYVHKTNARTK